MDNNPVVGKVCKHAYLSFHRFNPDHDMLVAKVTYIRKNGQREDHLIKVEDFKRDFHVVKEKYRKFKDKKDYIEISKCDKHTSNEARLPINISKVLFGRADRNARLQELKNNPYLFGCQETVPVLYKELYFKKYPDYQPQEAYTVAAYDVETYIMPDGSTGEVNMASTTCQKTVYWAGTRKFFPDDSDEVILKKLKDAETKYLSEYIEKHNVKIEYVLCDTPGQVVYNNIQAWHRIGPDYIVSWNANFDMEANENSLGNEGYDLAQVYSDPSISKPYQDYFYYKGRKFKTKVDGSQTPLDPHERFPVVDSPSKWVWFDGMSFYAIKRAPQGKKESYALQATAENEGIEGKLYIPEASHLKAGSTEWHKFMQKEFPYVYAMYNIRDNWTIEDLNRETNDYSLSLPSLLGSSSLSSYQSQPSMISDKLSFIAFDHGYVWGTVGRKKDDPFKAIKPDLKDWIALLHAELNEDKGKCVYEGLDCVKSMGRGDTDDIDVSAAYPTAGIALNVANKTTQLEVCAIEGLDRTEFRRLGINYASSPIANAVTLCHTVFGMPQLTDINNFYIDNVLPFVEKEKTGA